MSKKATTPLSPNVQMYLVNIARLRADDKPVPLSQLAQELSISPISVNEMCRKLQNDGLVIYRPYKGASLTPEGERRANYILRRHRLWEVLLVEKLGFEASKAHEAACALEHSTPDPVADRLDLYLGYPSVNPLGQPIPRADGSLPTRILRPLAVLSAGQRGHFINFDVDKAALAFLLRQGLRPGASFVVESTADESVLVQVGSARVSLSRELAETIQVEPEKKESRDAVTSSSHSESDKERMEMQAQKSSTVAQLPLHKLKVGQRGIVLHVGGQGAIRRRMMDMGLVTGAEVKVIRVAPLGDPVEFQVKGYSLSLRKSEARNITIEVQTKEDA